MAGLGAAGLGALGFPWLPVAIVVGSVLGLTSTIIQTKAAKRISREQIQAQQEALRQQLLMMQMQQEQQQRQQEMWMKILPIAVIAFIAFALLQPRR
jgi:Mg2+/citrate symporter